MSYFIRILSPTARLVDPRTLCAAVADLGCRISGDIDVDEWLELEAHNLSGEPLFVLERNVLTDGSLAEEELAEFQLEIADCFPKSSVDWLSSYLLSVKTIYAFQLLEGVQTGDGQAALDAAKTTLWNHVGGIFQADGEGFSNEEGYHILWQFSDDVSGSWWMAVLQDEAWQKFEIDLGNRSHRASFIRGEVPFGVGRAT